MLKQITAGIALASLVSLPALGAPERMSSAQLDEVVAGTGIGAGALLIDRVVDPKTKCLTRIA